MQDVFEPYSSDGWRSHNPYALAPVYGRKQIELHVYSGGGAGPGPPDVTEAGVATYNDAFQKQLKASDTPYRYGRGSSGKHAYPYWQADLTDFLAVIAGPCLPPAAMDGATPRP